MPRAIDHLVVAAHDLTAQAALYRGLGFQVGPRNRHPWGTENHIIQLDGAFLELIGLGEGFSAPPPIAGVYSFAGFVGGFLARREGIAMLVLRSHDAEADRVAFARDGVGDFERFDFARKGRDAEGREVDVAFSLAYAQAPSMPDAGFFVCQHHFPQNFWSGKLQVHANGARKIIGLVVAAERPQDHGDFLRRFLAAPAHRVEGGVALDAEGALIEVLLPGAVKDRYGEEVLRPDGPPLAAVRFGVRDLAATRAVLQQSGARASQRGGALVVAARDAMGATLVFEES